MRRSQFFLRCKNGSHQYFFAVQNTPCCEIPWTYADRPVENCSHNISRILTTLIRTSVRVFVYETILQSLS